VAPETHFIPLAIARSILASNPREAFLYVVTSFDTWPNFQMDKEFLRSQIWNVEPFNLSDALRTFYRAWARIDGKLRWGDKTPAYSDHMDVIQRFIPEARFIHLVRDGRDVALSHKGLWFGPGSLQEAGAWWASKIQAARKQIGRLNYYLEIRYEDLVSCPEPTLRQVCDFIALSWNPVMLDYHQTAERRLREATPVVVGERTVHSEERTGIHRLTKKPPQAERICRWRNEMDEDDRRVFEKAAGWMLRDLGYEVTHPGGRPNDDREQSQAGWIDFIERLEIAVKELATLIPLGQSFILVDDNQWGVNGEVVGRYPIPFLEHNGEYWGPPEDDDTAIRELHRLRHSGASFIVFAWPAFWWLDYYKGFHDYLRSKCRCCLQNERLVIFDLQM
jgi:hypothetical protein